MSAKRRKRASPAEPSASPGVAAGANANPLARALFVFFFFSGACSLVYEVVWLRLAMAQFGVAAVLVSIVLSVFMAGLALGSWAAGRWTRRHPDATAATALKAYALAELVIALSAWLVPAGFSVGRHALAAAHAGVTWGSAQYYVVSALCVAVVLLPFCFCMGVTFPLGMWAMRASSSGRNEFSFSYLYLANVVGATAGTFVSAFVLIELFGFRGTLVAAALVNAALAAGAFHLSRTAGAAAAPPAGGETPTGREAAPAAASPRLIPMLFLTGFVSMAAEVIWVRQFRPYLGSVVYTFALILGLYLAATFVGSQIYRRRIGRGGGAPAWSARPWIAIGAASLLPLLLADPRLPLGDGLLGGALRVMLWILPFCALLGFVSPMLIDRWSAGNPDRAGSAYAVNVVGCILGPLAAGFVLLPLLGPRWGLLVIAAPLLLACGAEVWLGRAHRQDRIGFAIVSAIAVVVAIRAHGYETMYPDSVIRRDHLATVIATGNHMGKRLLVNGEGMTNLTPITKMMAHLPLAFLRDRPTHGLSICFGMGTSFRSIHSWGIEATAIELVPSVPPLFSYFHADGDRILAGGRGTVIVDDGRRFLERTADTFDVIVIDPPPPVEAAGSSLLYSKEFYAIARRKLKPAGILQQWLPWGEPEIIASVVRALQESFPHVRVFQSVEGWGLHFLCSEQPILGSDPAVVAARLPETARVDLLEWGPHATAEQQFRVVLEKEATVEHVLAQVPSTAALTDDNPANEYFFLRRAARWLGVRSAL